jgi:hypothetical protein
MLSIPASQVSPHHLGDDRVITVAEAALRTGCSIATLKRCAKRGELKILKLSPRRIGVRLSDLKSFLDSRVA